MKRPLILLGLMAMMLFLIGAKGCNLEQSCYINNIDVFVDCLDELFECCYLEDQKGGHDFQPCHTEYDECMKGYANKIRACPSAGRCLEDYAICIGHPDLDYYETLNCWDNLDTCAGWYDDDCDYACFEDHNFCTELNWSLGGLQECGDELGKCQHGCWE